VQLVQTNATAMAKDLDEYRGRRTKSVRAKETNDKYGKHSSKHLRIREDAVLNSASRRDDGKKASRK